MGLVFFLKSLSSSPASITIPISSINIFGILTAVIFLSETFKTVQAISFLLAFVGILLVNSFSFKHDTLKWNVGATYALLASFFWGVTYTLFKYSALWLGVVPLAFILELCVTIVALVWLLFSSKDLKDEFTITFSKLKQYTILAALLIGGTIFLNLALLKLPVLLVNIFFNSNIIISVLFARIVYRELITSNQLIGILFIISSMLVSHIER